MTGMSAKLIFTQPRAVLTAWILWGLVLTILALIIHGGNTKTVTPAYRQGATSWLQGTDLYLYQGEGFIYLPQAAVAFVPFALLPTEVSEILWRCLIGGIFTAGLWRLAGLARREWGHELFPLMTLVCIPLAWSSLRNGQSTIPMTGLMMLAVADLANSRWWKATLWLSLGLVFKPLIVVFALLTLALHPPLRGRLILGIAGVFLFPFLFQGSDYVWAQYAASLEMLNTANSVGNERYYAQVFGLFRVAGIEIPSLWQNGARVVAAVATLGVCYLAKRRHSVVHAHLLLYALAAIYLMLFNPRTENNTYSHLAPALAVFGSHALLAGKLRVWGAYYFCCALAILGSWEIGRLLVPAPQAVWLAPLGCLAFALPIVRDACWGKSTAKTSEERQPPEPVHPVPASRRKECRSGAGGLRVYSGTKH
jgi:Glycosyltransferase family 87